MTYAAMIFVAIAIGVWVVAKAGGITGDPPPPVAPMAPAVLWGLRAVAGFVALHRWVWSPPAMRSILRR